VELITGDAPAAVPEPEAVRAPSPPPAPAAEPAHPQGRTAVAIYDYEATEENELTFPDGAIIEDVQFPDDDWWHGHYNGKEGLFVSFPLPLGLRGLQVTDCWCSRRIMSS
jgi:hypothetical protein